jgi:HAE1 family hydrophobic/amphiphilic exporter-1
MASLRWSMRHRWLVLLITVGVVAANYPLYCLVKQDYIPTNVDESEFEVSISAREGCTLRTMDRVMKRVEHEIASLPGVKHVLSTVGTSRLSDGLVYVQLQDIGQRSFSLERLWQETLGGHPLRAFQGNFTQREKMVEIRRRLRQFTDLRVAVRNQIALRQGAPVDIDFSIMGPDMATLLSFSQKVQDGVTNLPGIVDVFNTMRIDRPELLVDIDRQRAADLGVDVQEVADTLRIAVGGDDRVSRFRDLQLDEVYDVELRLVGVDRGDPTSIGQLYVRSRRTLKEDGEPVPENLSGQFISSVAGQTRLDNVVRFRPVESPERIDRLDRQRMAAIRANVAPGFSLGESLQEVSRVAREIGTPPGFSTRIMGRGRELERTFRDFAWIFLLSFIFMYLLLAAQFEHLTYPLTILFSLPLAVPFGLLSLWIGQETLNLYSALGILVLFGVVKKASILQVDHMNQLRAKGLDRLSAILEANRDRLRPILMTTVAFVAGMLPLLTGSGPGAEERRSIAVLAVGGQTLSLVLTLLAVPVVYSFFDDMSKWFGHNPSSSQPERETSPESATEPVATA